MTSPRWCPTPEQLMLLEELYRNGVRAPNASQIQQIAGHLAQYGRIRGKNVFYWFQNHKARERQRLRRMLTRHHLLYSNFQLPLLLPAAHLCQSLISSPPPTPQQHQSFQCQYVAPPILESSESCNSGRGGEEQQQIMMPAACCRRSPPETLDLFPTKSTGGHLKN